MRATVVPWFRYGIPLGSATVLVALLDLTLAGYWALNDFGSFYHFHLSEYQEPVDFRSVFGLVTVSLRIVSAIFLWIFVLRGQRRTLYFWLPISISADILIVIHAVSNVTHYAFVGGVIWFLNIAVVVLLRFYNTSIIIQAWKRRLQNDRAENVAEGNNVPNPCSELHTDIEMVETHANCQNEDASHPQQNEGGPSSLNPGFLLMQPVGESIWNILAYYNDTPRLGAAVLIIFEIIWNVLVLSTHSLTDYLFGGSIFFMIKEEEVLMRAWRIALNVTAFYLVFRKRKTFLRFWLIAYFWTLFSSLSLFVYVLIEWDDPPLIQVFVTVVIVIGDNFVRFGVVYCVLKTTIKPPAVTPTSGSSPVTNNGPSLHRSHSLKSQNGPQVKKKISSKSTRRKYGLNRLQRLRFSGDPALELF